MLKHKRAEGCSQILAASTVAVAGVEEAEEVIETVAWFHFSVVQRVKFPSFEAVVWVDTSYCRFDR